MVVLALLTREPALVALVGELVDELAHLPRGLCLIELVVEHALHATELALVAMLGELALVALDLARFALAAPVVELAHSCTRARPCSHPLLRLLFCVCTGA